MEAEWGKDVNSETSTVEWLLVLDVLEYFKNC